jgi:hypothetical protein
MFSDANKNAALISTQSGFNKIYKVCYQKLNYFKFNAC